MRFAALGDTLQRGAVYTVLFLLPFSKASIEIGFGFMLAGWLLLRLDGRTRGATIWLRPSLRPAAIGLAAWLAACLLSVFVSSHLHESVEGFIGKWLEYALLFVIAAEVGAAPGAARRAMQVLAASSVLVAVEAVSQELWGRGLLRGFHWTVYERMTGPYENPIDLATYLMIAIACALGLAAAGGRRARWAAWALIAALAACLGRTLAFGVWVAFAAALAWLVCNPGALRRPALATLGGIAVAALGFMALRDEWYLMTFSDVGTHDRVWMWQAALGMIRDRPWLGHGINTFMANYLDYWVGGERMPRYAHNGYLQLAAETGVIGLAAFLSLLIAGARRIGRGIGAQAAADGPVLLGITAGLLGFLIQAGYDTNFFAMRQIALFSILAGIAVGLSERASPSAA